VGAHEPDERPGEQRQIELENRRKVHVFVGAFSKCRWRAKAGERVR
jgi:hypothetical protein